MRAEQEVVREKLVKYLKTSGIKQNFLSEQTNIPSDILSRFKNAKIDLWDNDLDVLDKFISERL